MKECGVALDKMGAIADRGAQVCDISQTRPELDRRKGNPFDILIEWLLIGLLAFMPLAFGVVHAWSEEVVVIASGAIVICFLLKLVCCRDERISWTWAYIPIGFFLFISIFQLVQLPKSSVEIISPNTSSLKTELLGDLPNADTLLKSMTLSFYPNATKHDLRLVLAVTGIFVVVLNIYRRPDQIKRLLLAITLIGGAVALITLGQYLFGNGKIFWFVPTRTGWSQSGPFVNHNNYGQFMNLSIGAALGLLLVKLHECFAGKRITPAIIYRCFSWRNSKQLWLLLAIISLGTATVFISLTRGGMLSMLIAIVITALLLAWRRSLSGRGWVIVLMVFAAFAIVLYISFDAVYNRLASLQNFNEAQGSRLQIVSDILIAFRKFPILGTGLGTHLVVYPMFDRSTIVPLAAHAENEYAQALEETGLLGLVSLIIFGIIIWSSYGRSTRISEQPIYSAAYGLGFGILAILFHSLSDFGQHLPANAILTATFCALLLGLARQEKKSSCATKTVGYLVTSKVLRSVVLLSVCGICVWAFIEANRDRIAEEYWKKARAVAQNLSEKNWQGTEQEYVELIAHASLASDYQPDNIEYRHGLNVYRWRSISRTIDPSAINITISEDLMPAVRDIVDEFHKICLLCPTYGPTYSMVGWLEKFILGDNSGAERIRKGFRLAPCNPRICFLAGYVDILEGRYENSVEKLNKAVQLDGGLFSTIINIYIDYLSQPQLAISIAGDDIGRLQYVANLFDDMEYADLAEQSRGKIKDLLEARCSQPGAPAWLFISLANIYRKEQQNDAAVECYRRALALDYNQVGWRLELAGLLMETGKIPEAMREAKICMQLRPESKVAERLVADLSVYPAVFNEEKKVP